MPFTTIANGLNKNHVVCVQVQPVVYVKQTTDKLTADRSSFKGTKRGVGVVGPITPGRASQSILKEHADDGHHGQASVGKLGIKLPSTGSWVLDGVAKAEVSQAKVALAIVAGLGRLLVCDKLEEARESEDLGPSFLRHHGDGLESGGHVGKFQVVGWREVAIKPVVLWHNVSDGSEHGHASVLNLGLAAALEDLHIVVLGESERVPKTKRSLVTRQTFEASVGLLPLRQGVVTRAHESTAKRGVGVVGPITPG